MATIPTCCVTGAIPGDGGACGDCDPCIDGEALVPESVKRLIAEKNSLLHRIGELESDNERLRAALYESFGLIEGRDGHVPERLRLIAMGDDPEQSTDAAAPKPAIAEK